jgi:hypothetical protein
MKKLLIAVLGVMWIATTANAAEYKRVASIEIVKRSPTCYHILIKDSDGKRVEEETIHNLLSKTTSKDSVVIKLIKEQIDAVKADTVLSAKAELEKISADSSKLNTLNQSAVTESASK